MQEVARTPSRQMHGYQRCVDALALVCLTVDEFKLRQLNLETSLDDAIRK
jgi:hypothetical protein